MKIIKIISQNRRDFWADMECEHCGHIEKDVSCYDDDYFHQNVIPNKKCKKCGKTACQEYKPMTPKYEEGVII